MPAGVCPSREELSVYIVGKLQSDRSEEIDMHLQLCADCQASLETISAKSDTLLSGLHESGPAGAYLDEPQCQAALARVRQIGCDPALTAREQAAAVVASDIPQQLGPYRLLAKLGQGGMGTVYKALHTKLDRVVALKLLPEDRMRAADAVARFEREMKAVGKLDHPNIVRASDADEEHGRHYLVMEYVDGIDLSELSRRVGPLRIADACEIVRQAAVGLEHAHEHGLVHRDVKPSNLMLTAVRSAELGVRNDRDSALRTPSSALVKILDLGLALLADNVDQAELTSSGQTMGTLDYMAPEQCGDSHAVDIRADIYSLGATLYKLLTGEPIFSGANYQKPLQKFRALATESAPSIQSRRVDIPQDLAAVIARMVAREPKDRYATPAAVAAALAPFCVHADLARLGAEQPAEASPASSPTAATLPNLSKSEVDTDRSAPQPVVEVVPAPPQRPSRRVGLMAVGGLAAALVAIVLYVQLTKGSTVRIEINDPSITAQVDANGIDITKGKDQQFRLEPGEHGLRIKHGDFEFETDQFILKKGDQITLKIELVSGKPQVLKGSEPLPLREIPKPASAAGSSPNHATGERDEQLACAERLKLPVERQFELPGGAKISMRLIPPGRFLMGSSPAEQAQFTKQTQASNDQFAIARIPSEGPQHWVTISQPFYLGKFEVTQEQWQRVMGANPSAFNEGADHPVEQISGASVQAFLDKVNQSAGSEVRFALPTEAQWEYACRAGTSTFWHCGDSERDVSACAWTFTNSGGTTRPVGQLKPNAWGLHDMHGNVWELCADWYLPDYYSKSPAVDPAGPRRATGRVFRGGSWLSYAGFGRSAYRYYHAPSQAGNYLGFRLAALLPEHGATFTNSLGMEFALVPKGKSWLGGGRGNPGNQEVEIEQDFYLGKYEVTQEEWQMLTGSNPSNFKAVTGVEPQDQKRFPVEQVLWDEAQDFIKRVNEKAKETGWVYRLPTVVEWEYACRGGPLSDRNQSAFDYYLERPATTLLPGQANFDFGEQALKRPCKVGSYPPNHLGLCDMHGNVVEWCEDEQQVNGALLRAIRGGCWGYDAESCRAARPNAFGPSSRNHNIGLRLARVRVADPHRRAAEWVLSSGRFLRVVANGTESTIAKGGRLPDGPFQVVGVDVAGTGLSDADLAPLKEFVHLQSLNIGNFWGNEKQTDALLEHLLGMRELDNLTLTGAHVTDAGVERLSALTRLRKLDLFRTKVSDAGLAHLAGLRDLEYLNLSFTQVTSAGLSHLKGLTNLDYLGLEKTAVTDGGLAHLQGLTKLQLLNLNGTRITGAGLVHLKGLTQLEKLYLDLSPATDAALENLKDSTHLSLLGLQETQVTDAGLAHLKGLTGLTTLNVKKTSVTAEGIKQLAAALPDCRIQWDGDVIEPTSGPDSIPRRADEGFVSLFDRQDLSGWTAKRSATIEWKNENGTITGRNRSANLNSAGQLTSQKSYKDFHFRCEVLAGSGVEPVIMFRNDDSLVKGQRRGYALTDPVPGSPVIAEGWGYGSLYADDFQVPPHQSRLAPAVEKDLGIKTGDWYRLEFIARQETVEVRINGKQTAMYTSAAPALNKAGTITLRCGAGANIAFRNLEIKELTATDAAPLSPVPADHDRRAAEWVLSVAGTVQVNGQELDINAVAALPKEKFVLTMVRLLRNQLSDEGLAHLRHCKSLTALWLAGSLVTDEQVAHFQGSKNLTVLRLLSTAVTDEGLVHFKDCKGLVALDLTGSEVTDVGLVHFKDCKKLSVLNLVDTRVTDAGLAHFQGCRDLTALDLQGTRVTGTGLAYFKESTKLGHLDMRRSEVTDAGLAFLKDCQNLTHLYLSSTKVTDTGLAHVGQLSRLWWLELNQTGLTDEGMSHLSQLKQLAAVNLTGTKVTDAGLVHFKELKNLEGITLIDTQIGDASIDIIAGWAKLTHVRLQGTKVTAAGIQQLKAKRSGFRIEWDGGEIIPALGRANDYDALATGRWTPVLRMPGARTALRNASIREGVIEIQDGHAYDSSITAGDLIVRANVQKLRGQNVMLTLRDVLGVYYSAFYAFDAEEHFGFGMRGVRFHYGVKQQFKASAGVPEAEFFELAFAAIGDTLTIYANGKQVGQIRDSDISRPGGVGSHATKGKGVFKDVEVMVLDKARESSPKE